MKTISPKIIYNAYRDIFNGGFNITPPDLHLPRIKAFIKDTYRVLRHPLKPALLPGPIPPRLLLALQYDLFIFSGFKVYCQFNESCTLYRDQKPREPHFEEFYEVTEHLRELYNKHYLKAEYEYVVRCVKHITEWVQTRGSEHEYNLLYQSSGCCPDHAALDGICLPATHPFWEVAYPPNSWHCTCRVLPVDSNLPTTGIEKALKRLNKTLPGNNPMHSMFRFNPATTQSLNGGLGRIFPPEHPYYGPGHLLQCTCAYESSVEEPIVQTDYVRKDAIVPGELSSEEFEQFWDKFFAAITREDA